MLTNLPQPDFSKGLLPAVIQDIHTKKVLMLGYMNQEAYEKTLTDGRVCFFSRSKNRLWVKGESSGHFLDLVECHLDCDQDSLLFLVQAQGPTCHTGSSSCFLPESADNAAWLDHLKHVIRERKDADPSHSYTASLFSKGRAKVAQKVGEEAVELVIEAMKNQDDLFKEEAADLLFHYLVLLEDRGIGLEAIVEILQKRHQK